MSSDNKHKADNEGYCTPSLAAELFATLVGLALVYGMITLVGNAMAANGNGKSEPAVHAMPPKAGSGHKGIGKSYQVIDLKQLAKTRTASLAAFYIHKKPKPVPAFTYVDEKGRKHALKELRGKVVLLNLWATWCGPCRHEMPGLDELQKKYGGADFEMLAISIDRGGLKKPRRFFNKIKIKNLKLYGDPSGRLAPTLRAFGMPTTLLIDRNGREVGRLAGPAEWNSKEAYAFIKTAISTSKARLN